ncbi:tRNA lysidine(34) synthetase TilS [Corynebacterium sp. S7]
MRPFWPRHSPHFMRLRVAVRPFEGPAVIGLSGGADSLSLVAAAAAEGKDVEAVVVDHGLQEGSRKVAEKAAEQARNLGIKATVVPVKVTGDNLEAAAREARYAALHKAAGARDVWVAHTADDQAETLILGALRGNPSGMSARSGTLVRPLLGVRRADTVGACAELGLQVWHDPMNTDSAFRRVRVRNEVIPLLSEILGGDATGALATTANRIAEDNAYIEDNLEVTTDCAELAADPPALRTRKVARWLNDLGAGASQSSISDVLALCTEWHGQGPVHVGGGLQVRRIDGRLRASKLRWGNHD